MGNVLLRTPAAGVVIVTLLATLPAVAQRFSFGTVAGGYLTRDFQESSGFTTINFGQGPVQVPYATLSKRGGYAVGLQAEAALTGRFSLSLGGIYKPLLYRQGAESSGLVITGYASAPVITWQFPILGEYRFGNGGWQPFVEGGPSFRVAGNLNSANPSHAGITAGFGLERQWAQLKLAPRIRYTHWQQDPRFGVQTEQNQLELLVGLGYATPELAHPLGRRFSFGAMLITSVTPDLLTQRYVLNDPDLSYTQTTTSMPEFDAGPYLAVNLGHKFSLEANAISRRYRLVTRYSNVTSSVPFDSSDQTSQISNFWEIPVLAKYAPFPARALRGIAMQPFVGLGPSFRTTKELQAWRLSHFGATAAAGVEFRWRQIRFTPELRFTHWGAGRIVSPYATSTSLVHGNQVQAAFGISY